LPGRSPTAANRSFNSKQTAAAAQQTKKQQNTETATMPTLSKTKGP
jgi:hypothetical protein